QLAAFQFFHELGRLVVRTAESLHNFIRCEDDVHSPLLIQPTALDGQAHSVQQKAIQDFGFRRDATELRVGEKDLGEPVERKQLGLSVVKVIQHTVSFLRLGTKKEHLGFGRNQGVLFVEKIHLGRSLLVGQIESNSQKTF